MPTKSVFELPIEGAAGYAAIDTPLYATLPQGDVAQNTKQIVEFCDDNTDCSEKAGGEAVFLLPQGSAFTILEEQGDYWLVQLADAGMTPADAAALAAAPAAGDSSAVRGYLYHPHCFINLPDVLPSAIYLCPNASASVMHSCGRAIPTLTGEQLYTAHAYNPRLGRGEYRVPLLYAAAKKLAAAQCAARAAGDCIVVYEGFRPLAVQQRIVAALSALAATDATVMDGITAAPWEIDWFISTGISKHQRGMAMDIGLAKVQQSEVCILPAMATQPVGATLCGRPQSQPQTNRYQQVTAYDLYPMPTPIHELSRASASLAYPVTSRDDIAWRSVPDAPAMTDGARRLRSYCTAAGLTPLASEWWHFNDLEAVQLDSTEHFVCTISPKTHSLL